MDEAIVIINVEMIISILISLIALLLAASAFRRVRDYVKSNDLNISKMCYEFRGKDTGTGIKDIQREVFEWQVETFPLSDSLSKAIHLKKEAREVYSDVKNQKSDYELGLELADCVILAFGIAGHRNIDIEKAIRAKLEINKARVWSEPDENGVYHHIKEN